MVNVLLAWLDRSALARISDGLTPGVPHGSAPAVLALRLARVRAAGHDVSVGGPADEVISIAAPIRGSQGRVLASFGILAPRVYIEEGIPELTATVVWAAQDVTNLLVGTGAVRHQPLRRGERRGAP